MFSKTKQRLVTCVCAVDTSIFRCFLICVHFMMLEYKHFVAIFIVVPVMLLLEHNLLADVVSVEHRCWLVGFVGWLVVWLAWLVWASWLVG